jgi:hypothetical protein
VSCDARGVIAPCYRVGSSVVGRRSGLESKTFDTVCEAIAQGRVHVSEHAYDEAVEDDLSVVEVIDETPHGEVIEDTRPTPEARAASSC